MACFDSDENLQFLDLDGVDDEEKKWILMSLQSWDPCVEGPWDFFDMSDDQANPPPPPECALQANLNNGMPQMPFEQYHSPVLIPNHVSPMSPQGYPPAYQIYHPPQFVPQFSGPMLPVVSGPIMPVPVAIPSNPAPGYVQPVTYPTYVPAAVPANPIYVISSPVGHPSELQFDSAHSTPPPLEDVQTNDDDDEPVTVVALTTSITPCQTHTVITQTTNGHERAQLNGIAHDAASPTNVDILHTPATEPVGMRWADLFNKENNANATHANTSRTQPITMTKSESANLSMNNAHKEKPASNLAMNSNKSYLVELDNPNYFRMGEILVNYMPDSRITSLQPRGLINRSNYCYINSILQAMLACPPMYNLLCALGANVVMKEQRKYTQIIDNMVKFVKEFNYLPAAQRVNRRLDKTQKKDVAINCDRPFEPNWIYKILNGMRSDSFVVEGRQEDAEEFLGCLLNGLNDEMLELMKLVAGNGKKSDVIIEDGCDPEWQVIGPKHKGAITHRTEIVRTPISDIFGGHIQTKLHRAGDRISNNIQPFFTLQLNIEKVNTVAEALEGLVCKNHIEGVTSSKTNEEVEAWQQVTIEELPVVLILHLKCFDFKQDGCTKIIKQLEFPVDLKIDSKLLSKATYQAREKQYKLFAVVYHDGKEATKGHYLTDAYHVGYASWLRYDDAAVKPVSEEQVLKPHGNRVPYLLFYRRCDTVRMK